MSKTLTARTAGAGLGLGGRRPRGLAVPAILALVSLGSMAPFAPARAQADGSSAPPLVVVAPVKAEQVGRSDQFLGRIRAIQSVDLKARVEGFLDEVSFTQGSYVKAGDLLYEIEKAPYEAAEAEAEAQVAAAQAAIAGAKASLKNAQTNLDRQLDLVRRGTVSQAVADDAQAKRDQAAAEVQSAEAQLKQAEAELQTAKLNLSYTEIVSPIAGRIGATNVTEGNLVNPSTGTLATVVQVDPIRVAFSIPEKIYVTFAQDAGKRGPEAATQAFRPRLELSTGEAYAHPGQIAFASNEIDPSTGSLVVYADFPNPNAALLPGAFVNVTVRQADETEMPVVPAPAVLEDRQGEYVFVVTTDDRAEQRRIVTAERVDSGFAVSSGLQEGETVIVAGVQKVRPGETVRPTAPTTEASAPPPSSGGAGATGASPAGDASGRDGSGPDGAGASAAAGTGVAGSDAASGGSSAPGASGAANAGVPPSAGSTAPDAGSTPPAGSGPSAAGSASPEAAGGEAATPGESEAPGTGSATSAAPAATTGALPASASSGAAAAGSAAAAGTEPGGGSPAQAGSDGTGTADPADPGGSASKGATGPGTGPSGGTGATAATADTASAAAPAGN